MMECSITTSVVVTKVCLATGALITMTVLACAKSSIFCFAVSCFGSFFSDSVPFFTTQHMRQGCSPSKVWLKPSLIEPVLIEYTTAMRTQAADCSTAHCPPMETIKAVSSKNLAQR